MHEIFNRKTIFQRFQTIDFDPSLHNTIEQEILDELNDYLTIFYEKKEAHTLHIATKTWKGKNVITEQNNTYCCLQENDKQNIDNMQNFRNNDIIIAINSLHHVNYLQEYLSTIYNILNHKGVFCGNFFGVNNLSILKKTLTENDLLFSKQIYPRFNPTISGESLCGILQSAGFTNIVISLSKIVFSFDSFQSATRFLKNINERLYITMRQKNAPSRKIFHKNLSGEIDLDFEIVKFYTLKK